VQQLPLEESHYSLAQAEPMHPICGRRFHHILTSTLIRPFELWFIPSPGYIWSDVAISAADDILRSTLEPIAGIRHLVADRKRWERDNTLFIMFVVILHSLAQLEWSRRASFDSSPCRFACSGEQTSWCDERNTCDDAPPFRWPCEYTQTKSLSSILLVQMHGP